MPAKAQPAKTDDLTRFQKLARALFRVDKREIPKHVPKKRVRQDEKKLDGQ